MFVSSKVKYATKLGTGHSLARDQGWWFHKKEIWYTAPSTSHACPGANFLPLTSTGANLQCQETSHSWKFQRRFGVYLEVQKKITLSLLSSSTSRGCFLDSVSHQSLNEKPRFQVPEPKITLPDNLAPPFWWHYPKRKAPNLTIIVSPKLLVKGTSDLFRLASVTFFCVKFLFLVPNFSQSTHLSPTPWDHSYAFCAVISAWLLGLDNAKTTGRSVTFTKASIIGFVKPQVSASSKRQLSRESSYQEIQVCTLWFTSRCFSSSASFVGRPWRQQT